MPRPGPGGARGISPHRQCRLLAAPAWLQLVGTRLTGQAGRAAGMQGLGASCPGAAGHGPDGSGGQDEALHRSCVAGVWLLRHGTHAVIG